jgi:hypothetical protein
MRGWFYQRHLRRTEVPLLPEPAKVVQYVLAADVDEGTLGSWTSD